MNINLPHASVFVRNVREVENKNKISMEAVVERFINSDVQTAIEKTNRTSINVQVPFSAYENLTRFYALCEQALAPLGYKSSASYDGGGTYNTLSVTW